MSAPMNITPTAAGTDALSLTPIKATAQAHGEDFIEFCLRATEALIREIGWVQKKNVSEDGSVDLATALQSVIAAYYDEYADQLLCWDYNTQVGAYEEITAVILFHTKEDNFYKTNLNKLNDGFASSVSDIYEMLQVAREGYRLAKGPYTLYDEAPEKQHANAVRKAKLHE